jgi:hypothetical protein
MSIKYKCGECVLKEDKEKGDNPRIKMLRIWSWQVGKKRKSKVFHTFLLTGERGKGDIIWELMKQACSHTTYKQIGD